MPIPKTFSPPGTEYSQSIEDALRYAVWLMFYSDNVLRNAYSSDPDDENAEVHITQERADVDPERGTIVLPQLVVNVAIGRGTWKFQTGAAGEKNITIATLHMEARDTSHLDTDVDAPPVTPETRVARMTETLMRGTLWKADMEPHECTVIDPFRSPRNPDGTYDQASMRALTNRPPDIRPTSKSVLPIRRVRSEAEFFALDPVRDFAVTYGVFATYTVDVPNRENMALGGS